MASDVVDQVRARLLLHKKEGLALENTLRLAEELGMLDGRAEQIIDSTPMLGAGDQGVRDPTVSQLGEYAHPLFDSLTAGGSES